MEVTKVDGRLVRAQKTYDEIHSKLLKSAVELFNNSPLQPEKITVTEIAKHAGVSTATAYNHFPENKFAMMCKKIKRLKIK